MPPEVLSNRKVVYLARRRNGALESVSTVDSLAWLRPTMPLLSSTEDDAIAPKRPCWYATITIYPELMAWSLRSAPAPPIHELVPELIRTSSVLTSSVFLDTAQPWLTVREACPETRIEPAMARPSNDWTGQPDMLIAWLKRSPVPEADGLSEAVLGRAAWRLGIDHPCLDTNPNQRAGQSGRTLAGRSTDPIV